MINQSNWKTAEAIVRKAIHEMDPYGLLSGGAPEDEFDSEVHKIIGLIKSAQSEKEITEAISEVMSDSFEPELFKPELCKSAGKEIFKSLKQKEPN